MSEAPRFSNIQEGHAQLDKFNRRGQEAIRKAEEAIEKIYQAAKSDIEVTALKQKEIREQEKRDFQMEQMQAEKALQMQQTTFNGKLEQEKEKLQAEEESFQKEMAERRKQQEAEFDLMEKRLAQNSEEPIAALETKHIYNPQAYEVGRTEAPRATGPFYYVPQYRVETPYSGFPPLHRLPEMPFGAQPPYSLPSVPTLTASQVAPSSGASTSVIATIMASINKDIGK